MLTTRTGVTGSDVCVRLRRRRTVRRVRGQAATEAEIIEAARLCLEAGADVNAVNDAGQTALHFAVTPGARRFIRFLIEHGARPDIKDAGPNAPRRRVGRRRARARRSTPVRESTVALLRAAMNRTAPN